MNCAFTCRTTYWKNYCKRWEIGRRKIVSNLRCISLHIFFQVLHMTLGILQNLFNKVMDFLTDEEKQVVEDILKGIGAVRSSYHGHAFEGRGIQAILNNLEKFPPCISRTSANEILRNISPKMWRKSKGPQSVKEFLNAFKQIGLRLFLKVHVTSHVPEYFSIVDSFCKFEAPALACLRGKALESLHHHFRETWRRNKSTTKAKNALVLTVWDFNYVRFLIAFSNESLDFIPCCMFQVKSCFIAFWYGYHICRSVLLSSSRIKNLKTPPEVL